MVLSPKILSELAFGEAEQIRRIRSLESRYRQQFHAYPFDLSHWNAGPEYSSRILNSMILPPPFQSIDYLYGDERSERHQVLKRLGFSTRKNAITLAPSATAAGVLCGAFLKRAKIKSIHIVCPAYFTSFRLLELLGIRCESIESRLAKGQWSFSEKIVKSTKPQAIWITDPVFSVGQRWPEEDVQCLRKLAESGTWIVIDQALGNANGGLHQALAAVERVIGIHSPHKTLCVNSFKFAAIVHCRSLENFFAESSDIAYGGLSIANLYAVRHYLTPNFLHINKVADETVADAMHFLSQVAANHPYVSFSRPASGFFSLCVVPDLHSDRFKLTGDLWRLLRLSGTSFLPGRRSHMPADIGFSLRLNLMRDSNAFRAALIRLIQLLEKEIRDGN
jgi:DNA-binding transcriptional MocR family regulator